jgi:hypothetical protein
MSKRLRVGLIAVKNGPDEQRGLLSYLNNADCEPYRRGRRYDLVWFLNVTPELRFIKQHTDAKAFVVAMEPEFMYPLNYDADLLSLADVYMGYRNFAAPSFRGVFDPFVFPLYPQEMIRREFDRSLEADRDHDFCIFATHDPNIRKALGRAAGRYRSILAGPLFDNRVSDKLAIQRCCRYELITENDLNDYYCSEKPGQALVAGCIPVYWGCTRIKEILPASVLVDVNDFCRADGTPDIARLLEYCLSDGVYEAHCNALRKTMPDLLVEKHSLERCLIEPVQRYIDELTHTGWRARKISAKWGLYYLRTRLVGQKGGE